MGGEGGLKKKAREAAAGGGNNTDFRVRHREVGQRAL